MADPNNSVLDEARKRARRRLVGAVVLALAAAVALPLFLESDPKPLGPDVQIQIPAIDDAKFQNRLTPAGATKAPAADQVAAAAPSEPAKSAPEATGTGAAAAATRVEPQAAQAAASKAAEAKSANTVSPGAVTPAPKKAAAPASPGAATPSAATKPEAPAKKSAAPVAAPATASVAALPAFSLTVTVPPLGTATAPGPSPQSPAGSAAAQGAFVVQLGAFVDATVAKELAAKAGEQGFTAYLEGVTTQSGPVQRVRVGPFATRAEADAAAGKLRTAGFTAVARPR